MWRKGPRSQIAKGRLCWVIATDKWPMQQVRKLIVLDASIEEGVYILRDIQSKRVEVVNAARVFTEPWIAERELKLLQQESNKCYAARALTDTKPLTGKRFMQTLSNTKEHRV